ncbi:hypothetical protein CXB51_015549 [Gossypium anomalum]|uniref:Uncharacterized protein n=1 Tax=Gossypium anomalum TaxID=47600 RepID=A0A8J5YU85_9ROSI|nr:hypothetical protein CXB51_015549 [Gossypium anomalum]
MKQGPSLVPFDHKSESLAHRLQNLRLDFSFDKANKECVWRGGLFRGAWHEWKNRLEAAGAETSRVSAEKILSVLGLG